MNCAQGIEKFVKGILLVSSLIAMSFVSHAQNQYSTTNKKAIELYTEADNYYVRGQFERAMFTLNEALKKDKDFEEVYFRMGLIFKKKNEFPKAAESYAKGLALVKNPNKQNAYRFELSEVYLKQGSYSLAQAAIEQYLANEKMDPPRVAQAKVWKGHCEYALAHRDENLAYHPKALSDTVNCFPMQYSPAVTGDNNQLLFTKREGRSYNDNEDIFVSKRDARGRWTRPVSISSNINSKERGEGTCSISADGRHLIFTVCGEGTYGSCDLFESKKTGDTWSDPENLGPLVNSAAWDSQPSLSADGNEIYFVSSRPGGIGRYDIWYARKDNVGRWMKAENLGNTINTAFDEVTPFIHVNNRNLYFASSAHPGFGGLDIFVSEKVDKKWSTPTNMGAPLNNYQDQYSFIVTTDGRNAYYSKDELGNDSKLYTTPLPEQTQVHYFSSLVNGRVTAKGSGAPLQAIVELYDIKKNERVSVVQSDSINGEYAIVLTQGAEYALYSTSPGYLFKSLSFNYSAEDRKKTIVVDIELEEIKANATAVLNNVFFETDKYDLQDKSMTELQEVIRFLQDNPKIRVEIGGHTDNVGAAAYNVQLSQKRAQSVAKYLVDNGIETARIIQKGYGSQQPVKPNDNDENRQANRRIEFKILK